MRKELNLAGELLPHGLMCLGTILADPPWRFANRTGKIPPEHKRLSRYSTMTLQEIKCGRGLYLELFAREKGPEWTRWGDELQTYGK